MFEACGIPVAKGEWFSISARHFSTGPEVGDLMGVYDKESLAYGLDGEEIWRLESKAKGEGRLSLYARANVLPSVLWVRRSRLG
jgi:hypothetical protein